MKKSEALLITAALFAVGCKKPQDPEFDRGAMLTNMASAVIKPAYSALNSELENLHASAEAFTTSPDLSNLAALRNNFANSYRQFVRCKMYNFGPAEAFGIKAAMDTYPTDTALIESNISSGIYTLGSVTNIPAIGFPAIDYLLWYGGDTEVLVNFTSSPAAPNRKLYLTDITAKMSDEFQLVLGAWNGSYSAEFVAADGTDAGSSASLLFNEWLKDIELLKNAQIGIPCGQFSAGELLPEMVCGYYSGLSKSISLANLEGLLTCFKGGAGSGFDDYIADVQGEESETNLEQDIVVQFDLCEAKLTSLGDVFSADVLTNTANFTVAYNEIKKLVTYTKTDMASVLGLLITYSDADGD